MENIPETLKKIGRILWYGRSSYPFLDFAIPSYLSWGGYWFLARGDEPGLVAFLHLPFEEKECSFIKRFLKPGMVFFDIGANQGFYTLLAARKVGKNGKVFAFEPVPREFKNLKCNAFINGFKKITVENLALGFEEGIINMFNCLDGKGSYSSLKSPSENVRARRKIIEVISTTLDSYVAQNKISVVDFVKIDVEGGELDVLKGGVKVLEKLRPVLMCEVSEKRIKQWGYSAAEVCDFVGRKKYRWFEFGERGSIIPFSGKGILDKNLLAVPEERIKSIIN